MNDKADEPFVVCLEALNAIFGGNLLNAAFKIKKGRVVF